MGNLWTPNSWQSLRAEQQPNWGDEENYNNVIQEITEEELFLGVKKSEAKRAFAIIANPHTGKILALANHPTFDPNKTNSLLLENTLNLAVATQLEPGSVLKPIIIAQALGSDHTLG